MAAADPPEADTPLEETLQQLSADVAPALEAVGFPAYVIDRERRIRWINESARELFGDVRGKFFPTIVAPESVDHVREQFTRKLLGDDVTDFEATMLTPEHGRVRLEFSSVPISDGHDIVGVFGLGHPPDELPDPPKGPIPQVTRRQYEVLTLLSHGCSTKMIASELKLSEETVRNHIRALLHRLDAHSRLGAVAAARRYGIL